MGKVIDIPAIYRRDLDPDQILQMAIGEITEVVIIGFDKDGQEYFASSLADGGDVLWHLEIAKKRLLEMADKLRDGEVKI